MANRNQPDDDWRLLFRSGLDGVAVYSAYLVQDEKYRGGWKARIVATSALHSAAEVYCQFIWTSNMTFDRNVSYEATDYDNTFSVPAIRKVNPEHHNCPVTACFYECKVPKIRCSNSSTSSSPAAACGKKGHHQRETTDQNLPTHVLLQSDVVLDTGFVTATIQLKLTNASPARRLVESAQHQQLNDESENSIDLSTSKGSIALCVSPMHSRRFDTKSAELLEHIEFHRTLGVGKAFYYLKSVSDPALRILRYLEAQGHAELMKWNEPDGLDTRYHGQLAAINECILRTRSQAFKYTIVVDLDEIILPRVHKNYDEMMNALEDMGREKTLAETTIDIRQHPAVLASNKYGAFVFNNAFFRRGWESDNSYLASMTDHQKGLINAELVTMSKVTRESALHPDRSKCIVKPEFVVDGGVHFTWEFTDQQRIKSFLVPDSVALSHHYRVSDGGMDGNDKDQPTIIDKRARTYLDVLAHRVADGCRRVFGGPCP